MHVVNLMICIFLVGNLAAGVISAVSVAADGPRPRARGLGINPGVFPPGPLNAITDAVSPLFQAALEAVEEAVYNSMFQATTTTGSGRTVEAIPIDSVRDIRKRHALVQP
jgi:hypothetical protein